MLSLAYLLTTKKPIASALVCCRRTCTGPKERNGSAKRRLWIHSSSQHPVYLVSCVFFSTWFYVITLLHEPLNMNITPIPQTHQVPNQSIRLFTPKSTLFWFLVQIRTAIASKAIKLSSIVVFFLSFTIQIQVMAVFHHFLFLWPWA